VYFHASIASHPTIHIYIRLRSPQDTLKISGEQVSPAEIEDTLFALPGALVSDVCVAGVGGLGRTGDEKVRFWNLFIFFRPFFALDPVY
jgi:acyl-CoA synthetase (AMP-forming)/AMP-acid ligase II